MGKPIRITEMRLLSPETVRVEIDRSLTGTAHESFTHEEHSQKDTPAQSLAARLFETEKVDKVHLFSNVITITLISGADFETSRTMLEEAVKGLFVHYRPGILPTAV